MARLEGLGAQLERYSRVRVRVFVILYFFCPFDFRVCGFNFQRDLVCAKDNTFKDSIMVFNYL